MPTEPSTAEFHNPTQDQSHDPPRPHPAHITLESRPHRLFVAAYDRLPFPNLGPLQEIVFDLGVTAVEGDVTLSGLVLKCYSGHQMLLEQRWPARIIMQKTGQADLLIPAGTGLAVRGLHIMLPGYELLTGIEVTAVAKAGADGPSVQASLQIPVQLHHGQTDLHFPLEGTWWVIQGADWSDQHKLEAFSQPFALDFAKLGPESQIFRNHGLELEDHYSWGQPVYAAAGGKVAYVSYDMPDVNPGAATDPRIFRDDVRRLLGNAVAISHANGEFSYYAHLQQASIMVNQGELIKRGKHIGNVGNSGHSPGPHLHFHLMEGPNLFIDQGLPVQLSHFEAGGQFFEQPITVPTRMIVTGPPRTERHA